MIQTRIHREGQKIDVKGFTIWTYRIWSESIPAKCGLFIFWDTLETKQWRDTQGDGVKMKVIKVSTKISVSNQSSKFAKRNKLTKICPPPPRIKATVILLFPSQVV